MESAFRVLVIQLILDGRADEALELLAKHYKVSPPKIKVGLPKGRRRNVLGCYRGRAETIFVLDSETLKMPSVILHEFYHHLRTSHVTRKHRGTEKHATRFAKEFINALP